MSTMYRTHDTGSRAYNPNAIQPGNGMSSSTGGMSNTMTVATVSSHPRHHQQQQSHYHHRSRNHSKSRSRSRSHSRSINDSLSRSPTPKKRSSSTRHHDSHSHRSDRTRKRTSGGSRGYHSRRDKRQTRELPYPSRSRSTSRSKSRSLSRSRSRSASYSNDSDGKRRHRRHRRDGHTSSRHRRRSDHDNQSSSRRRDGTSRTKSDDAMSARRNHMGDRDSRHTFGGGGGGGTRGGNTNGKHGGGGTGATAAGAGGPGAGDKAPVSFKEFTNQMLEDDVTAQEAQKRYEKYLQRFSKSDDVLFFEAHKDEEWFQERYDPIIIEKSIDARRQNACKFYREFYEQFLADELPDVHDNVCDYKPMPNHALSALSIRDDADDKHDHKQPKDEEQKQDTGATTAAPMQTDGGADDSNSAAEGAVAKDAIKQEETTTTTTTIGGGGASGSSSGGEEDGEQREGHDDDKIKNDGAQNAAVYDADGNLRLPKYLDDRFKLEYVAHVRESSPFERPHSSSSNSGGGGGARTSDRSECYQNSVFIQGIPLHIPREKIETPFTKFKGFEKLILSDPIRNARKVRYGWVTFDCQQNCRAVLATTSDGGLNGYQLTQQYHMNLLPKQKSKRRPKFAPPESLYPHRVLFDVKQCYKLAKKFDAEAGIVHNPLLRPALMSKLSDIRRLNLLLFYLRKIHFLCYYCGKHFLSEEHMFARCSGTHERKVPHDISLAMSGSLDLEINDDVDGDGDATKAVDTPGDGDGDGGDDGSGARIVKKDKTSWEKELDQRISDLLNYVIEHKWGWMERKQIKMLEKNTKKVSEGKFRCTVCSKLFKADVFVFKHIKNKHSDEIAKYIADQRLRTMFENYRRDRDRLTMRSFEDNDSGNNHMHSHNNARHLQHMSHMHEDRQKNLQHQHQQQQQQHQQAAYFHAHGLHAMNLNMGQAIHLGPILSAGTAAAAANGMFPAANVASLPQHLAVLHAPAAYANANLAAAAAAAHLGAIGGGTSGGTGVAMAANAGMNVDRNEERRARFQSRPGPGPGPGAAADALQDPYGRKIPVHYQESATRTRRSYKEVDVEFPDQESEEEIDYGFGDFVKNPTKFNL